MAWTAPRTWVTAEVVTAAQMNAHIRDNFLETAPAKVTTTGQMVYSTGANALAALTLGASGVHLGSTAAGLPAWKTTGGFTGDASYAGWGETSPTDFNAFSVGAGTQVAVSIATGVSALVFYGSRAMSNSTIGGRVIISYRVSGATTVASSAVISIDNESDPATTSSSGGRANHQTALTEGTNTFTLTAQVTAGLGTITSPFIIVHAL